MHITNKFKQKTLCIAITIAISGSFMNQTAFAEDVPVPVDEKVERIAVVGSRAAPRSIADSPVPIDIIGSDEINRSASTDMLEILKGSVPSLNVHANPISDTASLVRPANLRGLSADSTLILVNGKRRHRSSVITFQGGGINDGAHGPDISVFPSIALKQVEVLRDGAAAQYGSDAIAGVINFVLRDDAEGGSLEAKVGEYYEGDGTTAQILGNIGMPLTQDGFVNLSFSYKDIDPTSRSVQRPDAAAFAAAGVEVDDPAQVWGSPEISDDISIFANLGLELDAFSQAYLFGNYSQRDVKGGFYYRNPNTRGGVYSNPQKEVDENGNETIVNYLLVGDLTDGPVGQINPGLSNGDGIDCPNIEITSNNIATQQNYIDGVANDPNCFAFTEMLPGGFTPNFGGHIEDTSIVAGTRGEFQISWMQGIDYDFSGSYGSNESRYEIYNTVNASLGADTPRDFSPGKYIQSEWNFNADLVKYIDFGMADDFNFAFGAEWHDETFEILAGDVESYEAGPLSSQGFSVGSNGFPGFTPAQAGEYTRTNYAGYIDIGMPFTDNWLLEAAVRYEDYETFGSTTNYKLATNVRVTDDIALRGSYNTGFRAPTVGQANVSTVQTSFESGVLVDSALLPPTNPIALQLGSEELSPEKSSSYTLGVVYTLGEVYMTLDYYNIQVDDRISQSAKIDLTDADKAILIADGVPNVAGLSQVSYFTNDFDTTTQGVDFVANYSTDLLLGDSSFALVYNWNETKVDSYTDVTGDFKVSRLENDLPNHRATFTWNQAWEYLGLFTRVNYYGEYQGVHVDYDATAKTASDSVTVDMELSYYINEAFTVAVGAQNIFDKKAELIDYDGDSNAWGGVYYETSPYGFNGGYYYLKGIYRF
ncbi:TonB-dependent receptor [uncultured Shewanella sp.]|uniref:TonB-dependent receptor plug domain-containing protein n=1 Tax=uncultured Shewanella sp. TaxID=173975 RepID=UPI0026049C76|nr:TonB-dependent receptor [uncultured Shewanella sp.]